MPSRLSYIFDRLKEGVWHINAEWRIEYVNPAGAALIGEYAPMLTGKYLWTVFPRSLDSEAERVCRLAMEQRDPAELECYIPLGNLWVEVRAWPDDEGGIVINTRDVSQWRKQNLQLQAALVSAEQGRTTLAYKEEQLRLATEAAEIGLWDVDPNAGTLFWPPRVKAMFGISPDATVSMEEDFYPRLHPDDRERVAAAFAGALDPVSRALYDVEYRTIGKEDGLLRWVAAKGRGVFDESGKCVRVIGTAIDITARKQAEEDLKLANQRKNEFIATLSHELRNPLAPIRTSIAIFQRSELPPRLKQAVEIANRNLRHLVRLVDDLLDVTRVSRGMFTLQMSELVLQDVIRTAVEQSSIADCGHNFFCKIPDEPLRLKGDPTRLAQLVGNLLTNSCKYTPADGDIELCLTSDDSFVRITVRDTGQGFDPSAAESLFERYVRGNNSSGLGIGLALARDLARMHGGTLNGESKGIGHGATFTLCLPRSR